MFSAQVEAPLPEISEELPDGGLLLGLGVAVGFLVFFPLFWIFICYLISLLGGWNRLATRFKTTGTERFRLDAHRSQNETRSWQSGRIGIANYNNILRIRVTEEGLGLGVMFLFKPWHPSLFIPWEEIEIIKDTRFLWLKVTVIEVGDPKIATLQLPQWACEEQPRRTS